MQNPYLHGLMVWCKYCFFVKVLICQVLHIFDDIYNLAEIIKKKSKIKTRLIIFFVSISILKGYSQNFNSNGEIIDEKFDKLMDVLDVIKKGFRSGSNHYNQAEIKTIYNILPNQTKILSEDEILQLQELIMNLELKEVA